MQVMFVPGLEFAFSKSDDLAPREIRMTWLADAGHRLRSWKCGSMGVWI